MVLSGPNKKRKQARSFIFRGKNGKKKVRQIIEAILMLVIGSNLIVFLNTLPSDFITTRLSKEIWIQLYTALSSIFNSLSSICVALIVITLLIASLLLILGGIFRLLVIYSRRKSKSSKNKSD